MKIVIKSYKLNLSDFNDAKQKDFAKRLKNADLDILTKAATRISETSSKIFKNLLKTKPIFATWYSKGLVAVGKSKHDEGYIWVNVMKLPKLKTFKSVETFASPEEAVKNLYNDLRNAKKIQKLFNE